MSCPPAPEVPESLPLADASSPVRPTPQELSEPSRLASPAAARNRDAILGVLREMMGESRRVLELASGSGEHAVHFASGLPHLCWQPTDASARALASIVAWREEASLPNLQAPLALDVLDPWPEVTFDALVAINLVHISPWRVTTELMRQAGRRLPPGGVLYLYGPYKREGRHTAPSNEGFDIQLRSRNPLWGVRDLGAVIEEANRNGLTLDKVIEMPANNLSVVFRR